MDSESFSVYDFGLRNALYEALPASGESWNWLGLRVGSLRPEVRDALSADERKRWIIGELTEALYRDFYVFGKPQVPGVIGHGAVGESAGGSILDVPPTPRSAARFKEVPLNERSDDLVFTTEGFPLLTTHRDDPNLLLTDQEEESLSYLMPTSSASLMPGFVSFDVPIQSSGKPQVLIPFDQKDSPLCRVYLNCSFEDASRAVASLIQGLSEAGQGAALKAGKHEDHYERADCIVVYCTKHAEAIVSEIVFTLAQRLEGARRDLPTPAFVKPLGFGVGLADDPNTGESFGQHRCRLVAEALVDWRERGGAGGQPARMLAVVERFRKEGISPEWPHRMHTHVSGL